MTRLDHIAVVAPDLVTGVGWVREVLGIDMSPGGSHPEMGTHNRLARLGDDVFLEVIAVEAGARRPTHRRWFGLDDGERVARDWTAGRRLRAYVARCTGLADTIGNRSDVFGRPMPISRGDRRWLFGVRTDGALPADGALPCLIDWGARGTPAPAMPDLGLSLKSLDVDTPEADAVRASLDAIGMADKPDIRPGATVKLIAAIDTPSGVRLLT
jgi:hypothetical protein